MEIERKENPLRIREMKPPPELGVDRVTMVSAVCEHHVIAGKREQETGWIHE